MIFRFRKQKQYLVHYIDLRDTKDFYATFISGKNMKDAKEKLKSMAI
jgi:hypothetical protein